MNKKMKTCMSALMALVLFSSCSQEDIPGNRPDDMEGIKISVNDFYGVGGHTYSGLAKSKRRVSLKYDETNNKLKFSWTMGDRVAVFGANSEQQIGLQMKSINDENGLTAWFDSESYRLDEGKKYLAYYPAINNLYQEQRIPMDYTGQVQDANNSTTHIGDKDYIVTPWTETSGINNISFAFQHIGAVLWLNIKMPDNATQYRQVTLSADDAAFTESAKIDLPGVKMVTDDGRQHVDPSCIVDKTMSKALTLNLTGNVTADADNMLKVWMMVLPADFTERTMTVTVTTANGDDLVYKTVPGKSFLPGMAYRLDFEGGSDGEGSGMVGPVFETDGKRWRFTSGNLYYDTINETWHICDKQTDFVNAGGLHVTNGYGKDQTPELIGLFSWGATGLEDAQKPTTLKENDYDKSYSGYNFPSTGGSSKNSTIKDLWANDHVYDWGRAYMEKGREAGDGRTYITPSKAIITQLMTTCFVQGATIKSDDGKSVTGLIVIPGIKTPNEAKELINKLKNEGVGVSCLSSMQAVIHNNSGNTLNYKNITIDNYGVLKQLNDAIFFPAASKRNLNSGTVYKSDGLGWYWTSDGSTTNANCLYFNGTSGGFFYNGNSNSSTGRFNQMAVRLLVEVE